MIKYKPVGIAFLISLVLPHIINHVKESFMAFTTTVQPAQTPAKPHSNNPVPDALLSLLILTMYGAKASKKQLRRLKFQFFTQSLKLKAKSLFKKNEISDRTLIYILLGIVALFLVIYAPIAALILALVALILILAGVI